ncbi:MAG: thiamine diphosphokinase [bacterium]
MNTSALILLHGEPPPEDLLHYFANRSPHIIATDGAAEYALECGLQLNTVIGDMDSLNSEIRATIASKGINLITESDQNTTDFEKALEHLIKKEIREVTVLGLTGKRSDHVLSNLSVMLRYADQFDSIKAYDIFQVHHFLTAERQWHSFNMPIGTHVSLTPLPQAQGVTTSGLYYPLRNSQMNFGEIEGIDNIIIEDTASVQLSRGSLLVSTPYEIG